MFKITLMFLFSMFLSAPVLVAQTLAEREKITENYDLEKLSQMAAEYAEIFAQEKQYALEMAIIYGWEEFLELPNGGIAELVNVSEDGRPIYIGTTNREGGITTRTDRVHTGGTAGLDLNGENMIAGIWDGGRVRETHELLQNRVDQIDGTTTISDHSTHVAGTMIGTGTVQGGAAKGMAPEAELWAYSFNNNISEMTTAAANGLLISNHSYGITAANVPIWQLGYYSVSARNVDNIVYNAPYHLPVFAAGNARNTGVNPGDGGYDILTAYATGKNIIVSAATFEVLNYTGPGSVIMSSFSSWGPPDDGRIKPDLAAKGVSMFSSTGTTNNTYANFSGTSMSSPNTSGSLILLQQHYNEINNEFMLSSTLRGLVLHTADEAGTSTGPDYRFGWGLMNTERAAETITDNGTSTIIIEETLQQGEVYTFSVQSDGVNDLWASVTWTDPPGNTLGAGNNDIETPSLINDLDIRVSQDGGSTFFPWKLDVNDFTAPATTGDNLVDNIEKIEIPGASGEYIIRVSHKGFLFNDSQVFSIIITGIDREEFYVSSHQGIKEACASDGSAAIEIDLAFSDGFSDTINFTVSDLPAGTTGAINPSSLNTEGTVILTVGNIGGLAIGDYQIKVTGTGSSEIINVYIILRILEFNFTDVGLLIPVDGATEVLPFNVTFEWEEGEPFTYQYDFELALDVAFTNIVNSEVVNETTIDIQDLEFSTEYFWRVRPKNLCGQGPFSNIFSFTTTVILGIEDIPIKDLIIYPNPANDVLNIEASVIISSVELFNVLGQILITQSTISDTVQLDISSLSPGNYFVRVTADNNSEVIQIVKR